MIEFISKLEGMAFKTAHVDLTVRAINGGTRVFIGGLPAPTAEEYRADIEKARKEGREEAWRTWPSHVAEHCAKARADEREQIMAWAKAVGYGNNTELMLYLKGRSHAESNPDYRPAELRGSKPPEPKPLEHIEFTRIGTQIEQITDTVNSLVDAVKGIQAWIAGQST